MTIGAAVPATGYTPGMVSSRLKAFLDERAKQQKRKKYSVREVAAGCGLSPNTIQSLLTNKFDRIDKETMNKICTYLECQLNEWLVWTQDEPTAAREGGQE